MKQVSANGKPRVTIVQFPGSNCDMDCFDALERHFDIKAQGVWHTTTSLPLTDAVLIPGGFSYGDYLRSGALASHSPIMMAIKTFVEKGGPVIGICNGFQVLTESHLLPGALLANTSRKFHCRFVNLKTGEGKSTYQSCSAKPLQIPVAHGEGRYYIDRDGLKSLQDKGMIAFQYCDANGEITEEANPNGSVNNIAGVVSENGRVMGMMPHPERATDQVMGGSDDGLRILESFFSSFL